MDGLTLAEDKILDTGKIDRYPSQSSSHQNTGFSRKQAAHKAPALILAVTKYLYQQAAGMAED